MQGSFTLTLNNIATVLGILVDLDLDLSQELFRSIRQSAHAHQITRGQSVLVLLYSWSIALTLEIDKNMEIWICDFLQLSLLLFCFELTDWSCVKWWLTCITFWEFLFHKLESKQFFWHPLSFIYTLLLLDGEIENKRSQTVW